MRRVRFAIALLGGLIAAAAVGQPPAAVPPAAKDETAKAKAEKDKPPEWPKEIAGKDAAGFVKDLDNHDPAIRNTALITLPEFGPDARKTASKALVRALAFETLQPGGDTTAATSAANAVAALGLEDADVREGSRILGLMIASGSSPSRTMYRQYAVPALAALGHRAENAVTVLCASDVIQDRAYEIRRAVVAALPKVAEDEVKGPSPRALDALSTLSIKDVSAAVRVEAFQSLVVMGPPIMPHLIGPKGAAQGAAGDQQGAGGPLPQAHPGAAAGREGQAGVGLARLAVMRFDPDKEINDANLDALAKLVAADDVGTKLHALKAFSLLGERAAKKLNDLIAAMNTTDGLVLDAAARAIMAMGDKGKPAIPAIKAELGKMKEPYFKTLMDGVVKYIEESKPSSGAAEPEPEKKPDPKGPAAAPKK